MVAFDEKCRCYTERAFLIIFSMKKIGFFGVLALAVWIPMSTHAATTTNVSITDFQFTPAAITIVAGDTVVWKNNGSMRHIVNAVDNSYTSDLISVGASYQRTFINSGTYPYFSLVHGTRTGGGMAGTITVTPAPPPPPVFVPPPPPPIPGTPLSPGGNLGDLLAQVVSLSSFVQQLQAQLAKLTGGIPTIPRPVETKMCPAVFRTILLGSRGQDVKQLQEFLHERGYYTAFGFSDLFGAETESALKEFQCRLGIVCSGSPRTTGYGALGPTTREAIRGMACAGGTVSPPGSFNSCALAGVTIPHQGSRLFYSQPQAVSCQAVSQLRICNHGVMSGGQNFAYSTCGQIPSVPVTPPGPITPPPPVGTPKCTFLSYTFAEGESKTFFSRANAPFGDSCDNYAQVRSCRNGVLTGSHEYFISQCRTLSTSSCTVNGATVLNGQTKTFFDRTSVSAGSSCSAYSQSRTCTNGEMSGDNGYMYQNCTDGATCTVGVTTLASHETRTFYSLGTVPTGSNCGNYSQSRTCVNGVVSGDGVFNFLTCSAQVEGSCTLDNTVVLTTQSRHSIYKTSCFLENSALRMHRAVNAPTGRLTEMLHTTKLIVQTQPQDRVQSVGMW
mgnify:FL=1